MLTDTFEERSHSFCQDFVGAPASARYVLGRGDYEYELRMRHHTEGIDETVMFFLPVGGPG